MIAAEVYRGGAFPPKQNNGANAASRGPHRRRPRRPGLAVPRKQNAPPNDGGAFHAAVAGRTYSSQFKAPPVLYSVTRVSKKFFSFFKSITSLIHGNGLATL